MGQIGSRMNVCAIGNCSTNLKLCLKESCEVKKACLLLLDMMSMRETAFVMLLDCLVQYSLEIGDRGFEFFFAKQGALYGSLNLVSKPHASIQYR